MQFFTEENFVNEISQLSFIKEMSISKTTLVSDITEYIQKHFLQSNIIIKAVINEQIQQLLED